MEEAYNLVRKKLHLFAPALLAIGYSNMFQLNSY